MTDTIETQNIEQNKNIQENTVQHDSVATPDIIESENPNEAHWRKFREQRKEERRQLAEKERELQKKREEAEALKKALESVVTPSYPQQAQPIYDPYANVVPNQDEEKRILDKVNALLESREKEREQRRLQEEHARFPERLRQNYGDFNQVCSEENLDYLQFHYPEVAKPLSRLQDSYEKWEDIYKAVKKFIPQDKEKDMKKLDKNLAKPVAMSRSGMSSTTEQAPHIGLSDEQKAKNWERMRKLMKGV